MQTLKVGCYGDAVKVVQCLLSHPATGTYDESFSGYVEEWQIDHNLTADGIIGEKSWQALAENAPTVSTSKNRKGFAAMAVQILVGADPDGIFGSKTKNAVAAWQSANGLTADGIVGKKTWSALLTGTCSEKVNNCVHYLQWDSRWKKTPYTSCGNKKQTIGNSGCGTTSMAMILATWIDSSITPVETSKLSVDNGFRTKSNGTSWSFYEWCFKHYDGFSKFIKTSSLATLESALKDGALAVCSMNSKDSNFWTSAGHYIVAVGTDGEYIYANDPNKSTCPRKQRRDKFKICLKQAFIFYR